MLRLIEPTGGTVIFDGVDIATLQGEPLRKMRRRMQMVFQDPLSQPRPAPVVESILVEGMRAHGLGATARSDRRRSARDCSTRSGCRSWALRRYPHEFSGGQRQRIGIARALASSPT